MFGGRVIANSAVQEEKGWVPSAPRESRGGMVWWCIEDPFEVTHNLGRVADKGRCASRVAHLAS